VSDLVPLDRVWVKFGGDRGGDGPMTLGQRNTYQWVGALSSDRFLSMDDWVFQVPSGTEVKDLVGPWGVLMSRHESLRTTYPQTCGADGWPVQRVAVSGELGLAVYRAEDEDADETVLTRQLMMALREHEIDLESELPVRVGVAVEPLGGVRAMVAVYSHMAVDFASMAVLGREFTELMGGRGDAVAGARRHEPLDQAAVERSPRGRERAEAALRYWGDQLRTRPQCLYAMPETGSGDGPMACWLRSSAATTSLSAIIGRAEGATAAAVVLAAVSAILGYRTANQHCMFVSLSSNRFNAQLRDYVGSLAQDCLIVIDTGTNSFDELVRRAGNASLRAHRHGMFDSGELAERAQAINRDRGTNFGRDSIFNNLSAHGVNPGSWELIARSGDGAPSALADAESTLEWGVPLWDAPVLVQFKLLATEPTLELELISGDTRRVPRSEFELVLRGVERLLVAAAAGDADLGRLSEITGVEPVVRDEGWVRVDSCWVELAACQRLAEEALPGSGVRVFAVPGPDGDPALTAYLTPEGRAGSPADAHQACMRLLPGRPTGMAPGWYVLCASAPGDPQDLDAWQRQPVLANGNGRPDTGGHENTGR
jgi:hypothetical protein